MNDAGHNQSRQSGLDPARSLRLVFYLTLLLSLSGIGSPPARAEYSQEFSFQANYYRNSGYYLVNDEKVPLSETRYLAHLRYGYFLTENTQLAVSLRIDESRYTRSELHETTKQHTIGAGMLFNLPDGAKGYALSTSSFIPYIGLQLRHSIYPDNPRLYVKAGKANSVEVLLGGRYFIFNRIAWHVEVRASTLTQPIEVPAEDGTSTSTYRHTALFEFQPFGLALFW
jgi:hypothetical protein